MLKKIEERADGICTYAFENAQIRAQVSNYGCTLRRLQVKDKNGEFCDVVLRFKDTDTYLAQDGSYLGAVVGRVANRIARGEFHLNGQTYHLACNNGPNSLHGGNVGFSYRLFTAKPLKNGISLEYLSPDGEEGYPGNLRLTVNYTIAGSSLRLHYRASSDADTLINITNHSYFNLNGEATPISGHFLQIHAAEFGEIDRDILFTGKKLPVAGTAFDFQTLKQLDASLHSDDPQIKAAQGLDHHFFFKTKEKQVYLYSPQSGIGMQVSTTLPGAQIYSANFLNNLNGADEQELRPHNALCIETQEMPNSINLQADSPFILRQGEQYETETVYRFEVPEWR